MPSEIALNAARSATSVLPYPTSPTTRRSIGCPRSRSAFTSAVAFSWSTVSSYGNAASISCCHGESGETGRPDGGLARRVQLEQLLREVRDRLADARLGALPIPAAEPRQGRVLPAGVARDALDLLDRHPDPAVLGELQLQEVALLVAVAAGDRDEPSRRSARCRGRCGRPARPGCSRSSRSLGTTRRSTRGRRTRTVPKSSRSVTTTRPSGPPAKPELRLRSISARPPAAGASFRAATGPRRCPPRPGSPTDGPTGRTPARPAGPRAASA